MVTMKVNVYINCQILTREDKISPTLKKRHLSQCSSHVKSFKQDHNKDLWLLNNGCSNHMIGNKKLFPSIDSSFQSEITLGNYFHAKAIGKGVVSILTKKSNKKIHS